MPPWAGEYRSARHVTHDHFRVLPRVRALTSRDETASRPNPQPTSFLFSSLLPPLPFHCPQTKLINTAVLSSQPSAFRFTIRFSVVAADVSSSTLTLQLMPSSVIPVSLNVSDRGLEILISQKHTLAWELFYETVRMFFGGLEGVTHASII